MDFEVSSEVTVIIEFRNTSGSQGIQLVLLTRQMIRANYGTGPLRVLSPAAKRTPTRPFLHLACLICRLQALV